MNIKIGKINFNQDSAHSFYIRLFRFIRDKKGITIGNIIDSIKHETN